LNFRRDKQSTKGKRWDRTAFAESGRRVDAAKIKANKGRRYDGDDDEVMTEEDDLEPLAPLPKPLVDLGKQTCRIEVK
jgi:ATP-dependent DNA helicase MPH1